MTDAPLSDEEYAELQRLRAENARLEKEIAKQRRVQRVMLNAINELEKLDPGPDVPPSLMSADEYAKWLCRRALP